MRTMYFKLCTHSEKDNNYCLSPVDLDLFCTVSILFTGGCLENKLILMSLCIISINIEKVP